MKGALWRLRAALARLLRAPLLRLGAAYLRLFPQERLSAPFRDLETQLRRRADQSARLEALLAAPLAYLDVGARGGLSGFLAHYRRFLDAHLVEPEPAEAARLRAAGYSVVEKALAAEDGELTLRVTRKGGLTSALPPGGRHLDYYRHGSDRFEVLREVRVPCATIASVCRARGADFDLVKIDTQGTELDVLRGMGERRPLFVLAEISFVDLYREQATFPALAAHLESEGYMLWDLSFQTHPAPGRRHGRRQDGLPVHGDAAFMPNWRDERGRALIGARPRAWAALMLVFGLEDVLGYILDTEDIPEAAAVRAALERPAGTLPLDLYAPVLY